MTSDYRIVVEVKKGVNAKPTQPSTAPKKTSPKSSAGDPAKETESLSAQEQAGEKSNPALWINKLAKRFMPTLSVAVAARTVYQTMQTAIDVGVSMTGDYTYQMALSNFNAGVRVLANPVGTALGVLKKSADQQKINSQKEMARELMGMADLGGRGEIGS